MKKFIVITLLISFSNISYSILDDKWAYPYLNVDSKNVKPPVSIKDALDQLDFVLKLEIIEHFKQTNEPIAPILICKEIGDFFINRWFLDYHIRTNDNIIKIEPKCPLFLNYFSNLGLNNPYLIMRVVFSCYHKRLNNIEFSIANEIEKIKQEFSASECNIISTEQYWIALARIKANEDSTLFADKLNRYSTNDTLGRFFHEEKRESSFYITGTIDSMDKKNRTITLKIFDIVSDKRYREVYYNDRTLKVGDTLHICSRGWNIYNELVYNYRYGKYELSMSTWNDYIKKRSNGN